MPTHVNRLSAAIKSPGMTKVLGYQITSKLFEELKANKDNTEGFTSDQQVHYSQEAVQDILIILKNPEERDKEIEALKKFVQQFEKLHSKKELTDSITLQYDTRFGWISKFFPKAVATTELLGTNYFQGFDTQQYKKREDNVMDSYDALVIIHNRLHSTMEE